jgi:hypothetical protein
VKPHPRARKAVKWTGAVVSMLLVAAWALSVSWSVGWYFSSGYCVGVSSGGLTFVGVNPATPATFTGFSAGPTEPPWMEWWFAAYSDATYTGVLVPLWILWAPALLITAIAWRLDILARRRAKVGSCAKCGYSRAGLAPAGECPECGAVPSPFASSRSSR